jgi:high-affinity iron transporter
MLLYVGYWLHSKSYADAWNRFIRQQVGQALAKRTVWAMAALSFLAVYREMFEIVLFYEALWLQAGDGARPALLGGIAVAAAALAAFGFAIFKYSLRLPLKPFFAVTSALLVALAIAFAGNGVAALQEAGVVAAHGLPVPSVPILGIHPSLETLGAQLLTLVLVIAGYWLVRSRSRLGPHP